MLRGEIKTVADHYYDNDDDDDDDSDDDDNDLDDGEVILSNKR